jgi:REP element-mobilizing transposase RayT
MARPLRIEFPGAIYHVIARGNARATIFSDDHDRRLFLSELVKTAERLDWWLWAYCLMGNHYHLVLETVQPTLARGMRDVNGNYSQAFNRRHDRVGHVFQGRYRSIVLDKEGYLPQVIRYVLMNPVRAGLVDRPDDWYWSSFLPTTGTADVPPRLAVSRVLALFDPDTERAPRTFAGMFSADAPSIDWPTPVRNRAAIGSAEFVDQLGVRVPSPSPEVARVERTWKSLSSFENDAPTRDDAIRAAYACGAYTLQAIGDHFGLHYTTVSQIVHGRRKLIIQDLTP